MLQVVMVGNKEVHRISYRYFGFMISYTDVMLFVSEVQIPLIANSSYKPSYLCNVVLLLF
jgi:hypothetical protein